MTTTETTPAGAPLYARLWRGVPRELGFLLPLLPIVIAGTSITASVFFTGVGMIFILVGIFIVLAGLFVGRGFGYVEVLRLRAAGFPRITPPRWDHAARDGGWFAKLIGPVVDGHYWLYLLHTMIVNPIVGTVTWALTITWVSSALGGLTYWFWQRYIPLGDREWTFWGWLTGEPWVEVTDAAVRTSDSIFFLVVGILFTLTLPFVTRGLTRVHYGIGRGMLSAFASEGLREQVTGLAESRSAAVAAEGTALRRLERDIHDGPQQRLVRLQMDLAAADRKLDDDPDAARTLLKEALDQSREALDELRALSRGFAPPILLDRGLVAALESLAVRSAVPTTVVAELPEGTVLPAELERNAYFIAAEALTNAAKHAEASKATVTVRLADGLELVVTDDGSGGAAEVEGHGIAGLHERVRGLGGTLEITSPAGGPTVVTAHLPL
ncbi:MAG: sensor histidine kinase [Microbacteriaceae bacterium]|nr:sensor histidine kinase [Microbacteriaceae bacterium]